MPTHQLHIARVENMPDAKAIAKAVKVYTAQQTSACTTVIQAMETGANMVRLHMIAQVTTPIKSLTMGPPVDIEEKHILKAVQYDLTIYPEAGRVETMGSGRKTIDLAIDGFLINDLGLSFLWSKIDLPVLLAIDELRKHDGFRGAKKTTIKGYCHNSYMTGNYAATFLDANHGDDFMQEYEKCVSVADVRIRIDEQPVTIRLAGDSSFSFTVKGDADPAPVIKICRALAGWGKIK